MHNCLLVQELLSDIFRHIFCNPYSGYRTEADRSNLHHDKIALGTLAGLARTCKTFHEPALNRLWRALPSLIPLIQCLPPDAWAISESTLSVTKSIETSDFKRILFYSPRVRVIGQEYSTTLDYWDTETLRMNTQVLPVIWSRKPNPGPLLPNLLDFCLSSSDFVDAAIYPRLLVGLKLHSAAPQTPWDNITAVLNEVVPQLSSFIVFAEDLDEGFKILEGSQKALKLFLPFHTLEKLGISRIPVTPQALTLVTELSNLRILEIAIADRAMQIFTLSQASRGKGFFALSNLRVFSKSLTACQMLLEQVKSKSLYGLEVFRRGHHQWDLKSFFRFLCDRDLGQRLVLLGVLEEVFHLCSDTFEPLASFGELVDVQIEPCSSTGLTDASLLKMAKSWPKLYKLSLYEATMDEDPKTTFFGFQSLIAYCPQPTYLTLRINAKTIPSFSQCGGDYPVGETLQNVHMCTSPIASAEAVSAHLTLLLPNTLSIRCLNLGRFSIWTRVQEPITDDGL
ncbi:hypothetical protein K443DRAFT_131693 [Laccaria amethystina LaAM-08-1]|uniref:F-box domain-containing protein n=1 Tax=Laccaria amethystina LaAM-08-1 TaxID=1095629 RepID=A0A0C9Y3V8_9AGAR|nr:hypothetical protein K443DRAFT_131693 [Laccaria amethystina LaAM-08-1]